MTFLNEKVLDADKVRIIRLQADLTRNGQFFLAGGTGLGLRLGHRRSDDIDWFTSRRFETDELKRKLERLSEKPVRIEQNGPHTIRAYYGAKDPLETSFITYRQVEAKPESLVVAGSQILLADIEVMAAMKAAAVHDRGSLRDFVDIHTICQQPGWSVSRFIQHAASKAIPTGASRARSDVLRRCRQAADSRRLQSPLDDGQGRLGQRRPRLGTSAGRRSRPLAAVVEARAARRVHSFVI
jgi:hypothetical protein